MTRVLALGRDIVGAIVMVLCVPLAILIVGIPLVLVVRLLIEIVELL